MRKTPWILALAIAMPGTSAAQPATRADGGAAATGRAFTPADWYRLTTLSSPAMSPDGRHVAFTVTTVRESENKRHSEVWMVPSAGGDPVRLTSPGTESSNPRWSHDGKYLLFTSQRPGGDGNTWALRMDQAYTGEAVQLDTYPSGSVPSDGAFAVYAANDEEAEENGDEGEGEEEDEEESKERDPFSGMEPMARPPHGALTQPLDPGRFDGRHIVDFPYKANGRGFLPNRKEARKWDPDQLWIQEFGDTARRRLTDERYSHRNAAVSPDGQWIAFVADPELRPDSVVQAERDSIARLPYDSARDEAPRNDGDIFLVPVAGGEPRRLTSQTGTEGDVTWSPDSRRIAFISALARTESRRVWVVESSGGAPRNVLGDWQYEPSDIEWLSTGDIAMDVAVGGRTALFHLDPGSGTPTEVIAGRRRINDFSFDRQHRRVAFVATSVDPAEQRVRDRDVELSPEHLGDEVDADVPGDHRDRHSDQEDDADVALEGRAGGDGARVRRHQGVHRREGTSGRQRIEEQ